MCNLLKRYYALLSLTLVIFSLVIISCSEDPFEEAPDTAVSLSEIVFEPADTSITFTISNRGGGNLSWTLEANAPWISFSDSSGSNKEKFDITIYIDRDTLDPGAHTDSVFLESNGGDKTLAVIVNVAGISLSPYNLDFGTDVDSKSFEIANSGSGALTWKITESIDWLEVSPQACPPAEEDASITVTVDRSQVGPGAYSGKLYISSNGGSDEIEVYMQKLSPTAVSFQGTGLINPMDVYLNDSKIGTIASPNWLLEKEVEAGIYTYYFSDLDCGLKTQPQSVEVSTNTTKIVNVNNYNLDFEYPQIDSISVSQGDHEDKVVISWGGVSPKPSYYEVRRAKAGGSWEPLETVTTTNCTDYGAQDTVAYWYNVRPVWSCVTGDRVYSDVTGWTKTAKLLIAFWDAPGDGNVYLKAGLRVWGLEGETLGFASYWVDQNFNWTCNPCNNATMDCGGCSNIFGVTTTRTPSYQRTYWSENSHRYPYSCFPNYGSSDPMYGRFIIYKSSKASCNGAVWDYSNYTVGLVWVSSNNTAGEPYIPVLKVLSAEESRQLDLRLGLIKGDAQNQSEHYINHDCEDILETISVDKIDENKTVDDTKKQ